MENCLSPPSAPGPKTQEGWALTKPQTAYDFDHPFYTLELISETDIARSNENDQLRNQGNGDRSDLQEEAEFSMQQNLTDLMKANKTIAEINHSMIKQHHAFLERERLSLNTRQIILKTQLAKLKVQLALLKLEARPPIVERLTFRNGPRAQVSHKPQCGTLKVSEP